ncbi:two-component system, sensor histidine kinase YesM [Paenibacillus sp. 1_12]|uniref:sensor histidine kinase n=1 Tax=Paenibacillus sp. 1_12 TaxID=1566278 RepID=UPI0008F3B6FC|nr:sensor histidine kinase [Paenibacillus sp. 1_12]SFK67321.1 two-component system, sensor histidine kinase YesM [Paenibacillus sp. 1_12]
MRPFTYAIKPSYYANLKIKHKVFSIISLVVGICFLGTYLSLQYVYSIYDEQLYSKSSQLLNLSSSGIENELKKLDRISYNIATDLKVQELLVSLNEYTPEFEKYKIRSYITDRLIQYAGNEKYIYSIEIMDVLSGEAVAGQSSRSSSAKKQRILNESTASEGGTRWIVPDAEDSYLIAAREIRSYNGTNFDLNHLGTLTVRIYFDKIVENVLAGSELKNGDLQVTSNNHVIYPISSGSEEQTPLSVETDINRQVYEIKPYKGQQYFISQVRSEYLGWTYLSLTPFDKIFTKINLMKNILFVSFVVILLLIMAVTIKFARTLTKPIEELIGRMRQVQKGDFSLTGMENTDWTSMQMDEVGQLKRTFRMMIQQINELITENYSKQLIIKETQFKALQAQINPHFLYNTLESINWLAKSNGQPQISKMVESLGFLLRSSISLKETLITVGEELDIVMNYITIQRFRFEERLVFELDVAEDTRSLLLPKMTLQPLVENSIHYGLESMLEPCHIRIWTKRELGSLIIVVEDNGPGMESSLLEQVRRGEAPTRGSGIGLRNIEERIILAFGEGYGVSVESEIVGGTQISIKIPDETREMHV